MKRGLTSLSANAFLKLALVLSGFALFALPASSSAAPGAWAPKASMPTARAGAMGAEIGGIFFVAGGSTASGDTAVLESYDPATNTWSTGAPMPQGRYGTSGAVLDGELYVIGGWHTGLCCPTSSVYAYNPATNTWSSKASMPILSACSAAGAIGGKLYVLTACDGFSGYRNRLHVYDPVANSWSELAPAPHAHSDPAFGVIGGKLYVAGGLDAAGTVTATLDAYDPLTNTWSTLAPMPTARVQAGGAVTDGKLYVVGGWTGTSRLATLEVYDPVTNTWSTDSPMPTARNGVLASAIGGQLYAAGGGTDSGIVGTLEAFNPTPLPPNVVINTNDSGPGSLRTAIDFANTDLGPDTIGFAIPSADPGCSGGVCTIRPTSPLPALSDGATTIDGSTQGDTNPSGPSIVVNGSLNGDSGIVLASDSNHLNDLVVNGFTGGGSGIEIRGSNNSVTGSYVGLDATGTFAVQNSFQGISVLSGTGNVIGGSLPAERNVVSGNNGQGIWLASSGNVVRGDFVGTDRTGTRAVGNGLEGVFIWPCPFANCPGGPTQDNVVGGLAQGDRNVISGNNDNGVWIEDSANLVEGNFIGTDVSGTLALGNQFDGIHIAAGDASQIGGTTSGAGNVISGNGHRGIEIAPNRTGIPSTNTIQGNFIGTDQTGKRALPNGDSGVEIYSGASHNVVGGATPQARNVISGNGGNGVQIHDPATQFNLVEGNFIGTDVTGTIALGNTIGGVNLANGASANTIGGTAAGTGNLVSGNPHNGVNIDGGSGNLVQGNLIGTDASGTASLPNAFHGVSIGISASASDNRVERNVIAHNGFDGVIVAHGVNNAISRNSIFSNGGLGIDLGGDGVTPNDPGDVDTGPNNLQNFPVLKNANADTAAGQLIVVGSIDTPNPTTVTIEFFANAVPTPGGDPSGHGEGATFLGTVTPKANGKFTAMLPAVPAGTIISATATDAAGNSSEFAADIAAR